MKDEQKQPTSEATDFSVIDARCNPYLYVTGTGKAAVRDGRLDVREIAVYFSLNMITDNVIPRSEVSAVDRISKMVGLTSRQVENVLKSLHDKNVIEYTDESFLIIE